MNPTQLNQSQSQIQSQTQHFMETDGGMTRIFEYSPQGSVHFQTNRQLVQILNTIPFGPTLFLDGMLQSSSKDEHIYHEMLVHPMMSCLSSEHRERIAIFGGGEGCTAREVLRWPFANDIVMYDYDRQLVEYFMNHTTPWNSEEALHNYRVRRKYTDIFEEIHHPENGRFHGLVIDLTDPEPSSQWRELINGAFHWLHPTGAMVINAGGIYPWDTSSLDLVYDIAKEHIQTQELDFQIHAYKHFVPSFGREWAFVLVHHAPFNSYQLNDPSSRYYTPQKVELLSN